jgi:undecaprenyl diphosphate synthase
VIEAGISVAEGQGASMSSTSYGEVIIMSLLAMFGERFGTLAHGAQAAVSRTARAVGLPVLRRMASSWAKPKHAAFILDGNRRYAVNEKLATCRMGHEMGTQRFYQLIELCHRYGIPNLSVYAFSIENFSRSQKEILAILDILRIALDDMAAPGSVVHRLGCRVRVIGDRSMVPDEVRTAIERAERATMHHATMTVFISVAYDGREDIVHAARQCVAEAVERAPRSRGAADVASAITIEAMTRHMYLRTHDAGVPPVDLIVRTGGAKRLSSFLMWDASHAEIHFDPVLWPAFGEFEFLRALGEYHERVASSQAVNLHYWSKKEKPAVGAGEAWEAERMAA